MTAPIDLYIKVTVYGVGGWPSAETKYLSENSGKTKYLRKIWGKVKYLAKYERKLSANKPKYNERHEHHAYQAFQNSKILLV